MSKSSDVPRGRLMVRPAAGVEFRVTDARGTECLHGAGDTEAALPEGLYAVEWLTAGSRSETLVRLPPGDELVEVVFDRASGASAGQAIAQSAVSRVRELQPAFSMQGAPGSAIVIVVRAEASLPLDIGSIRQMQSDDAHYVAVADPGDALTDLKLCDSRGAVLPISHEQEPLIELGREEAARCYAVSPGDHLLSMRAVTGETIQQTIPALPGRVTMVFLSQVGANVLFASGSGFQTITQVGIDPAATVVITASGDEADDRIRERTRLARVLLHDIASGSGSLGADFQKILDDPLTDPLLRMLAVVVVIARLEANLSPAPDDVRPAGSKSARDFNDRWVGRARAWLGIDQGYVVSPDETVIRWRLGTLFRPKRQLRGRRAISCPPMFALTWRWAIAQSVTDPAAVPQNPANLAASRSAGGTEPWLCWKASAAKAAPTLEQSLSGATLSQLASKVAEKAGRLIGNEVTNRIEVALAGLSPEVGVAARRVVDGLGSRKGELAEKLAVSLGLPADALARRLARTGQEIDTALAQLEARGNAAQTIVEQAPGYASMIRYPDDPQKGRFGGQPECGGFVFSARFAPTRSRKWIKITLEVSGAASDGSTARFYLHDSFIPEVREATFRNGRAALTVTSFGGFTAGAWIPEHQVELELDLADMTDAPQIIKTR